MNPVSAMMNYMWPPSPTTNGWNTMDKPPAAGQRVVVWDGRELHMDTYSGRGPNGNDLWYRACSHEKPNYNKITHWRELPEPPKQEVSK